MAPFVLAGDLEAIDALLTRAGIPRFDGRAQPLSLLERVELLVDPSPDPFRFIACDRCDVTFGRSAEVRDAMQRFQTAHRHRHPGLPVERPELSVVR